MKWSNPECEAIVDEDARICPHCSLELKSGIPSTAEHPLITEIGVNVRQGEISRIRIMSNVGLFLAILSCPLLWTVIVMVGVSPLQWGMIYPAAPIFVIYSLLHWHPYMLAAGLIAALTAVIMGHLAFSRSTPKDAGRTWEYADVSNVVSRQCVGARWRPVFAFFLGYINIALIALGVFGYVNKGRPNNDRAECRQNLRTIHDAFKKYGEENSGMFPPLSSRPGVMMYSSGTFASTNKSGPLSLTCPTIRWTKKNPKSGKDLNQAPGQNFGRASGKAARQVPEHVDPLHDDQSYFYLGYAVRSDDDVEAFAQAYRARIAEGGDFEGDLTVKNGKETRIVCRLSERVFEAPPPLPDHAWIGGLVGPSFEGRPNVMGRPFPLEDDYPILIERDRGRDRAHRYTDWGPPAPQGAYVLYAKGGVHFVERGVWPMTEKTQRLLAELAE